MRIAGYGQYDPKNISIVHDAGEQALRNDAQSDKVVIRDSSAVRENDRRDVRREDVTDRQGQDVNEIAFRLRTSDGFNTIQSAFADLDKDVSLSQYQYFVGEDNIVDSSDDGIVIRKSGFDIY